MISRISSPAIRFFCSSTFTIFLTVEMFSAIIGRREDQFIRLVLIQAHAFHPLFGPRQVAGRFPQLNLHRARVRRNHGRLPSHGFIERAPEHRAGVTFFLKARLR